MNTWTNIVIEKVHKHSNTTNVLTTEQKVFWNLSSIILQVIYRLWFFQTPQSQFMILISFDILKVSFGFQPIWWGTDSQGIRHCAAEQHCHCGSVILQNPLLSPLPRQSSVFTSRSWWASRTPSTAGRQSTPPSCSSGPGSSAGPPRHNPLSRRPRCCPSHCSFSGNSDRQDPVN